MEHIHSNKVWPDHHNSLPLTDRRFDISFPTRTAVGPLYLDYPLFLATPKASSYQAFLVARGSRDIVVPHYFSTRYSHVARGLEIDDYRREFDGLSDAEGLEWSIRHLDNHGLFEALRSWLTAETPNKHITVKYEDLTGPDESQ